MKLGTTKEHLLRAIFLTERLVGKKESLPVLACLLLEATKKSLVIRSTNLEAGIEVTVPAHIEEPGIVAVSASTLREVLRTSRGETVSLECSEGILLIESSGSKNTLKTVSHEEFPALPRTSGDGGFLISRKQLLHALASVVYATSPSMIRPELGSVYLLIEDGALTAVATDSFRLAEKKIVNAAKKDSVEVLIPLKHAQEMMFVLDKEPAEEVTLELDETQCAVLSPTTMFISRVTDGTFPNYKEIIPKKASTEAVILKSDLTEIMRKAKVFAGVDQSVGLHIYPKKKIFSVTARSGEVGEMSDSLDAALSGEDLDINFHIGYLADCLSTIQSDSVTLSFAGPGKPLVIRGISDSTFMYLVMPLNR